MSCQKNALRCKAASVASGISSSASKAGNATGALVARATEVTDAATNLKGRVVAPVSNRVLAAIDRPTTAAAKVAPYAIGTALAASSVLRVQASSRGLRQGSLPVAAVAVGVRDPEDLVNRARSTQKAIKDIKKTILPALTAATVIANIATDLSEEEGEKRTITQTKKLLIGGKQTLNVGFGKTKLSGVLNSRDRLVSKSNVVSSQGDLIRLSLNTNTGKDDVNLTTWHRGQTVVNTSAGKQTITHLQSMTVPSTSHYFNRTVSDEEAASIMSNQVKPHKLPGHVGTIAPTEKLAATWGNTKRSMILTRLHWPNETESPAAAWQTKVATKKDVKTSPVKTSKQISTA